MKTWSLYQSEVLRCRSRIVCKVAGGGGGEGEGEGVVGGEAMIAVDGCDRGGESVQELLESTRRGRICGFEMSHTPSTSFEFVLLALYLHAMPGLFQPSTLLQQR